MSICAWCNIRACSKGSKDMPNSCPMIKKEDVLKEAYTEYKKLENKKIYLAAAHTEKAGYCKWPRIVETAEFFKFNGFKKIGLAFCIGLKNEALIVADFFKDRGFEVFSVVCCAGGFEKDEMGVPKEDRLREGFNSACNPIGQAKILNAHETEYNVVLGLCVGHDSLFFKYSEAPVTVLAAKDRVLMHNPLAAVYGANSYYKTLFNDDV